MTFRQRSWSVLNLQLFNSVNASQFSLCSIPTASELMQLEFFTKNHSIQSTSDFGYTIQYSIIRTMSNYIAQSLQAFFSNISIEEAFKYLSLINVLLEIRGHFKHKDS